MNTVGSPPGPLSRESTTASSSISGGEAAMRVILCAIGQGNSRIPTMTTWIFDPEVTGLVYDF